MSTSVSPKEADAMKHSGREPTLPGVGIKRPSREALNLRGHVSKKRSIETSPIQQMESHWFPSSVRRWDGPSMAFSGGRFIHLVLYGRISVEDVHSIWIEYQSTYNDIVKELAKINATCTFTVLEPIWGPVPRWVESNPNSLVGNNSHVLYAIVKDDRRYIVGVVRASLSDYPVAIFESPTDPSRTVTQAIIASRPELNGQIKSITGLLEGQSGKLTDLLMHRKSVVIINASDDSPNTFVSELPAGSIPPLLRVPFAYCENLMKQAYDLEVFALQIIHILRAILHIIISLAKKTEAAFKDDSSDVETALLTQDEVSEWLRATPMLARNLQEILDRVEELMGTVTAAYPGTMQREIEEVFEAVCGDYPGAVDVRYSHRLFTKLSLIDREEDSVPIRGSGASETGLTQPIRGVRRYSETNPKIKLSSSSPPNPNAHQSLQLPSLIARRSASASFAALRATSVGLGALTVGGSTSISFTPTVRDISLEWGDPPPYSLLPPIPPVPAGANHDIDNKGKKATDGRSDPASTLKTAAYRTASKRLTAYSSMSTIPRPPSPMPGPSGYPHAMQPNINTREEAGVATNSGARPHLSSPILTPLSSNMDSEFTRALKLPPKPAAPSHKLGAWGENTPINIPSKTGTWREDLETLSDRSGLKFSSVEHQDQQGTWWASYYLTNPDGSSKHLGSHSGKSKVIAKEHAAKQSYGTLTTLISTWTQDAAAASTSTTGSTYTDPGNFWVQELKRLANENNLRFVCDQLRDSQGTWWATYHLINPDGSRYFRLGSRGDSALETAIEYATHNAVETLNRWVATQPQPTADGSSG